MNTNLPWARAAAGSAGTTPAVVKPPPPRSETDAELRRTFASVVGEIFFGQMLKSMRKTVGKPAYFHGGRAEEIFRQQLDQVLSRKLSEASGETFTEPMFELFSLRLNRR